MKNSIKKIATAFAARVFLTQMPVICIWRSIFQRTHVGANSRPTSLNASAPGWSPSLWSRSYAPMAAACD